MEGALLKYSVIVSTIIVASQTEQCPDNSKVGKIDNDFAVVVLANSNMLLPWKVSCSGK